MKKKCLSLFLGLLAVSAFAQFTITINPAVKYQTIYGLGGQGTGDATYVMYMADIMGISAYRYYMDGSWAGNVTETDINSGSMTFSKTASDVTFFQNLKNKGVTNIVSTCWSPPASLKTNGTINQGGNLISGKEAVYGKFLAAFVKDFNAKTGQTIYAFNIQNEPAFYEPYPSRYLYADSYGPELKTVHEQFTDAAVVNTKFFGAEDMGSYGLNTGSRDYLGKVLESSTYGQYLDIFAVHSYLDGITADVGNAAGWDAFYQRVCVKNGKPLWMSETDWSGQSVDWATLMTDHAQMFAALKHGKVSAWIYWGMNTFYSSGPKQFLYVCKHYMRFIRPGYQQVDVTESDADVSAMAFINPANNDITVVAINTNKTKAKNFSFNSFANKPASFDMYRSSATENCGYVGKFTGNSFDMPAYSVVTLCFKAAESDWQWGPSAPTNIQASSITDNAVTITWNAVSGWTLHSASGNSTVATTGYTIYQNGVKKTVDGPTTKLTYTFTGLKPGTTYTFDVVTRDALYNESVLGRITVTTTCTTGGCITPPPGSLEATGALVTVSPNPASEAITLNLPDENIYNISVISISGAVALEKQNVVNGDQISVASLAKGIYVVIAQCGDKIYKTKLAVN